MKLEQDFINNTQALTPQKAEEKSDGPNYWFLIILFIVIIILTNFSQFVNALKAIDNNVQIVIN